MEKDYEIHLRVSDGDTHMEGKTTLFELRELKERFNIDGLTKILSTIIQELNK